MPDLVMPPSGLIKTDYNATYQFLNAPVRHDKRYMISKWMKDAALSHVVGELNGSGQDVIIGMVDGIQAEYAEVNNGVIPYSKTWTNARAYVFDQSINDLANNVYYGNRNPSIVFSQMMEDSNIHGSSDPNQFSRYSKVEQVFARVAQMLQADGISVEDNELVADYFCGIYGYDTNVKMDQIGYAAAVAGMGSELAARKTNYIGEGGPFVNNYYSQGAFNYRHRITPGYIEGLGSQYNGQGPYNMIYNLERNYIQHPDRKCVTYANGTFEGLSFQIDRRGVWSAYPHPNGTQDLIRLTSIEAGYDQMRTQTLIGLLLGDRYVIWDDNARVGFDDECFDLAYFGGAEPWKNRVRDVQSGNVSQYNGSPAPVCASGYPGFATNPGVGNNGSWDGNYTYGRIFDRCNGSLKYASFSYKEDGVTKNGYYNGNDPQLGTNGAEVSRKGRRNIGQANSAHQFFNGKRPIVWEGTGIDPSKKCWVVWNVQAGYAGETVYNIGGGVTITHIGDSMGVYTN